MDAKMQAVIEAAKALTDPEGIGLLEVRGLLAANRLLVSTLRAALAALETASAPVEWPEWNSAISAATAACDEVRKRYRDSDGGYDVGDECDSCGMAIGQLIRPESK